MRNKYTGAIRKRYTNTKKGLRTWYYSPLKFLPALRSISLLVFWIEYFLRKKKKNRKNSWTLDTSKNFVFDLTDKLGWPYTMSDIMNNSFKVQVESWGWIGRKTFWAPRAKASISYQFFQSALFLLMTENLCFDETRLFIGFYFDNVL